MKKTNAILLCLILALAMSACGSSNDAKETTAARETAAPAEAAEGETGAEEAEEAEDADDETAEDETEEWDDETGEWEDETEEWDDETEEWDDETAEDDGMVVDLTDDAGEAPEEIVVADYDPFQYVTLGEYTGLNVDMLKASVSDEDLEGEIESILEDEATEEDKTDGAAADDIIVFTYSLEYDGEELESSEGEELEITLGYTEFGEEVDQALTGAKAGDTVKVDVTLDDSYEDDLAGKTGTYTFNVARVYTYQIPELTDEFVKEHTDFDSVDAYKENLRQTLLADAEMMNKYDAGEAALTLAAENATFSGYPQDLYDSIFQNIEEQYMYFFGDSYTDFIDEADMEEGVLQEVNAQIVLKAIIQKENLTMTEEQFQQYLKDNLTSFGETYDTPEALAEAGGDSLRETAQRELATYWLLERDNVTELTQDEYDAKYNADELEYDEEEDESEDEEEDDEAEEPGEDLDEAEEAEGEEQNE